MHYTTLQDTTGHCIKCGSPPELWWRPCGQYVIFPAPTKESIMQDSIKTIILDFPDGQKLKFERGQFVIHEFKEQFESPSMDYTYIASSYKGMMRLRLGPFELTFHVSRRVISAKDNIVFFGSTNGGSGSESAKMIFILDEDLKEIDRLTSEVADLKLKVEKNEADIKKLKEKRK